MVKSGKNHGFSKTRLHRIWTQMRCRCDNKNIPDYKNYGGRGIRVCSEWNESFLPFRSWALVNGYADHLTIDRKDNNGNYEPGNCRWVTREEQQANRRYMHHLTLNSETLTISAWAKRMRIPRETIYQRRFVFGKSDRESLSVERLNPPMFGAGECAEIRRRRKTGQSMKSIARDLGCGRMTVFRVVHGVGRYAKVG